MARRNMLRGLAVAVALMASLGGMVAQASAQVISSPGGGSSSGGVSGATKRAMLAFGGSGNGAANPSGLVELNTRLPVLIPVTTTRWRFHVGNVAGTPAASDRTTAYLTGAVPFNNVCVGPAVLGADGMPTGVTTSMVQALSAFSTNADGTDYVSGWVTAANAQFTAHKMSILSYGWASAGIASMGTSNSKYWYDYGSGGTSGGALAGVCQPDPALYGTSRGSSAANWMDVRIEYEYVGTQSTGLVLGDSLTEALFSPTGGATYQTWHQEAGLAADAAISVSARGGQDTITFANASAWEWTRLGTELTPEWVFLYLGSNDMAVTVATDTAANRLAAIQARVGTVFGLAKTKFGIDRRFITTVPPRGFTGTTEATRVLFNDWVKTLPYGVDAALDFDKLLRDTVDATALATEYKGTDNIHHTRSAQTAEGVAAAAVIPRPRAN